MTITQLKNKYDARLLKLAAFLETLPRQNFRYNTWANFMPTLKQTRKGLTVEKDCGTVACALGWACAMPTFRRLGLSISKHSLTPRTKAGNMDYKAASEIFNLTVSQAQYLFSPAHGPLDETATPKKVAKHIRRYVKLTLGDRMQIHREMNVGVEV